MTGPLPPHPASRRARQAALAEQARQAPEEPQRAPTATEQLEALVRLRAANDGCVVQRPAPLTPEAFRKWLHATSEVGAPGDVEVAWHYYGNAAVKAQLENEYVALKNQAGRRHRTVVDAAERERLEAQTASEARATRAGIERQIVGHEAAIAELRRRLAQM
jgi:hypothetical protein